MHECSYVLKVTVLSMDVKFVLLKNLSLYGLQLYSLSSFLFMEYCLIEAQFLKKILVPYFVCMIPYSHQLSHNLWGTYPGASPHFPLTFIVPSLLFISTIYTSISTPMPLTLSHHTCDDYNDSTTIAAFLFPFPCFTA